MFPSFGELFKLCTTGLLVGFCLRHPLVLGLGRLKLLVSSFKVGQTPHSAIQKVLKRKRGGGGGEGRGEGEEGGECGGGEEEEDNVEGGERWREGRI